MFMHRFVIVATVVLCISTNNAKSQKLPAVELKNEDELNPKYWLNKAVNSLEDHLSRELIKAKAKNVIIFLGGGMSIPTITAARIFKGQLEGRTGEEESLIFHNFSWSGISKTYCVNSQVPDSACSATALLSGVKTNKGTIGVSAAVNIGDCNSMRNTSNHVESILTWAQSAKKSTGIVTTSRITHSTPAATYAHTANHDWEDDSEVLKDKEDPTLCEDIASQLINRSPGKDMNVILGGGRRMFLPANEKDIDGVKGKRKDGKNLIREWIKDKESRNVSYKYVDVRNGLLSSKAHHLDYLLGLFSSSHLPYTLDHKKLQIQRNHTYNHYPKLFEMVIFALRSLSRNPEGYVLFVEGGRIDHAHHRNMARKALHETLEFNDAIMEAMYVTSRQDTLIVVTADHSHTMSFSGYPKRGNDILGVAGKSDIDKLPYTTLSYANGPSVKMSEEKGRHNISNDNLDNTDYKYPSLVPTSSEKHGGEDVAVFASGCWAHLFSGVMEQNLIPILIGYASCLGPHKTYCKDIAEIYQNKSK